MTRCDSGACYCSWPPVRPVFSTGARYRVDEIGREGNVRVFVYRYEDAA